ncbi:MAG: tRNA dihydrouridine synthase DusB, partial [Tepidimonas taiwanensis]|nr:tRNA dihydrouridine synthase DusB [Tepidimonas taiwanensis]
ADLIEEHYLDILSFYGADLGLRAARKHLGWYAAAQGAPNRAEMMRAPTPAATIALIRSGFSDARGAA